MWFCYHAVRGNEKVMSVKKIMSAVIVTVEMDDSLGMIKEIFDNAIFHHLLVVESNRLVGVISDRDLLKSLSPSVGTISETTRDAADLNKKAHQIMSRNLITLNPSAGIYDAINIFNNQRVSCIPIINEENKPVGIISWRDILKVLKSNRDTVSI